VKNIVLIVILFLLSLGVLFAQNLSAVSVTYDGVTNLSPFETDKWHNIECTYEYNGNASLISDCLFVIGNPSDLINGLTLKYSTSDNHVSIMSHGSWVGVEAYGVLGENKIIQNDFAYVDCGNTTVTRTANNVVVNFRVRFKTSFVGSFYSYLYVDATNGNYTGFVNMGAATVVNPAVQENVAVISATYNGATPSATSPLETGKWYNIECKYQYKEKSDLLSDCIFVIGNSSDLMNGLALKYSASNNHISIIYHGGWMGIEATALLGANEIIQNDQAYVDCANTTVNKTKDDVIVTFKVKLKSNFVGNFSTYLYADATDGKYAGFVYMYDSPVVNPGIKAIEATYNNTTPSTASPVETDKWYNVKCTYEYQEKANLISDCIFILGDPNNLLSGFALRYSSSTNQVIIISHSAWQGVEASGTLGENKIIQNDLGYVDCGNTTVTQTGDNVVVNFKVRLKSNFTGNYSTYLYSDATDGTYTGFKHMYETPVVNPTVLQSIKPVDVAYDGIKWLINPIETDTWHDIKCTYEYNDKIDLMSNCMFVVGSKTNLINGLALNYSINTNTISIMAHGLWVLPEVSGLLGETSKIIENDQAYVDCENSTVSKTEDNIVVTYKVKFKTSFVGNWSNYLYADAIDGKYLGFTHVNEVDIVSGSGVKATGVLYNGEATLISPLKTDTWHNVECTYEYKNKTNLISNSMFVIADKNDIINGLTLTYSPSSNLVNIITHGTWMGIEDSGLLGATSTIIENDIAYVDCENTTVTTTADKIKVNFRIKFKTNFVGDWSSYLYSEATDGTYTGFVYMGESPVENDILNTINVYRTMPASWVNSLKPDGGISLSLANNQVASYVIVVPDNATTKERKAAYDLSRYFKLISNANFNIIPESQYVSSTNFISIGRTNLFVNNALSQTNDNLSTEGYSIDIINNNVYLNGGTGRGLVDGIYSILEEDIGCRWYTNENKEYVPLMTNFSVSISPRVHMPQLDLRDPFIHEAWSTNWSLRNKTNAPYATIPAAFGGSIKYHFLVHTANWYVPPADYFDTHPEYYALVNGVRTSSQLCYTNPSVVDMIIEKTKEIFRNDPNATITSVSPNDGRGFCDCPNCQALDNANGGRSGSYFNLINQVAAAIKTEFPDKKILALAYLDYATPPTNIQIADNVVVQLCTDGHAWKYQFCYTTESNGFQNSMISWGNSGAGIFVWDYVTDYVHMLVPMANMPVVSDNMRFYLQHNAKGIMLQGTCYSGGGDMSDMRAWVWGKQMWNPDLDTRDLMRDFIYGHYQECAEPIWNYQMMLWNYWEYYHAMLHVCGEPSTNPLLNNLMCSYDPDGPMFTQDFMTNFWSYITTAETLAQSDDMLWRIKKIKASLLYLELAQNVGYYTEFRTFKNGKEFVNGVLNNKAKYEAYYNELQNIITHWKISSFSEQNEQSKILDKWEEIFAL